MKRTPWWPTPWNDGKRIWKGGVQSFTAPGEEWAKKVKKFNIAESSWMSWHKAQNMQTLKTELKHWKRTKCKCHFTLETNKPSCSITFQPWIVQEKCSFSQGAPACVKSHKDSSKETNVTALKPVAAIIHLASLGGKISILTQDEDVVSHRNVFHCIHVLSEGISFKLEGSHVKWLSWS